ncbi:hypothetical protein J31TS3_15610 [Paenibacillus lactis]|nr:hypothetical protein J31TS3_15610 [Paenibacillus lactis]
MVDVDKSLDIFDVQANTSGTIIIRIIPMNIDGFKTAIYLINYPYLRQLENYCQSKYAYRFF